MTNETGRQILPIPDKPHTGLITYDAKDPDTSFPPMPKTQTPAFRPSSPYGHRKARLTSWSFCWMT
jgi:arylsulfatase